MADEHSPNEEIPLLLSVIRSSPPPAPAPPSLSALPAAALSPHPLSQTKTGITAATLPPWTGLSTSDTCAAANAPTAAYSLTAGTTAASITLSGGIGASTPVLYYPVAYFPAPPSTGSSDSAPSGGSSAPGSSLMDSFMGRRHLTGALVALPAAGEGEQQQHSRRRELITFVTPRDLGPLNLCAQCSSDPAAPPPAALTPAPVPMPAGATPGGTGGATGGAPPTESGSAPTPSAGGAPAGSGSPAPVAARPPAAPPPAAVPSAASASLRFTTSNPSDLSASILASFANTIWAATGVTGAMPAASCRRQPPARLPQRPQRPPSSPVPLLLFSSPLRAANGTTGSKINASIATANVTISFDVTLPTGMTALSTAAIASARQAIATDAKVQARKCIDGARRGRDGGGARGCCPLSVVTLRCLLCLRRDDRAWVQRSAGCMMHADDLTSSLLSGVLPRWHK